MDEENMITISELPAKAILLGTDKFAVDDGVHTYLVTAEQLREFLKNNSAPMGTLCLSQSSLVEDNPGRLPLFTGDIIPAGAYPDFFNWLKKHPELCISQANYDQRITDYGECPFYVLNENNSFRLPIIRHYIKAANKTEGIVQRKAGLPNITGDFSVSAYEHEFQASGAFGVTDKYSHGDGDDPGKNSKSYDFDASRSSSVYGGSDTVDPNHTTFYPWVSVINYAVPASVAQNQVLLDILLSGDGVLSRIMALEEELAALKANTKIIAGDNINIEEVSNETEE